MKNIFGIQVRTQAWSLKFGNIKFSIKMFTRNFYFEICDNLTNLFTLVSHLINQFGSSSNSTLPLPPAIEVIYRNRLNICVITRTWLHQLTFQSWVYFPSTISVVFAYWGVLKTLCGHHRPKYIFLLSTYLVIFVQQNKVLQLQQYNSPAMWSYT